jgi:hypothetical protein
MKHYYCSAFSGAYCYQGLVLYNSIKKLDNSFTMFYVCLDNLAYKILSGLSLKNLQVIKVETIEDYFPELKLAKQDRAIHEYAWTIKSSEILYIFENFEKVDRIIWLDGDTEMLSNTEAIFDEWGNDSIILTEQYYTGHHEPLIKTYGRFQAGFVGFCKDNEGLKALRWWRTKCIEWCYSKFEDGRWADQKYLDNIPELFQNICVVKSLGINMTPFILYRLNFEQEKYLEINEDEILINNTKLILYHYYGFKYLYDSTYDLCTYWMKFTRNSIEYLYVPYIKACRAAIDEIEAISPKYKLLLNNKERRICSYFDFSRSVNNATYDFATVVNNRTLQEAIALYYSLSQHETSFYWWVCCLDMKSFEKIKSLKLPNTTVVHIESLFNRSLSEQVKKKPDANNMEIIKAHFLYHLFKNNYLINKLIYINSDFFLFSSISDVFNQVQYYNALLFNHYKNNSSKQLLGFDNHIFGLINCKETVEFLQYCIDKPKGLFNLAQKISKYLNPFIIDTLEYSCTLDDFKHNNILIENECIYVNKSLIRAYHFSDNERSKDGNIVCNRKAKDYLSKDIYSKIYGRYTIELNKAMNTAKSKSRIGT